MARLFSSPTPAPVVPVVAPPAVMPTPDDALIKAQKKRDSAAAAAKSGIASTQLSDNGDQPLG